MNSNKRDKQKKMDELENNKPALTHEEYLEVVTLKNNVINFRSQGYNLLKQQNAYEKELKNIASALEKIEVEVEKNDKGFVEKMREYTAKHGLANSEVNIAVSDSEPHYITEVSNEQLSNPVSSEEL